MTASTASRVEIDGSRGEGGGQVLRTALALSMSTAKPFEMREVRARRPRQGLLAQHVAAVRGAALACGAKVHGGFEGSKEITFEPGPIEGGEFALDIGTAGSCALVAQTLLPGLSSTGGESRLAVTGGTHVPQSPCFEFMAEHWGAAVRPLGIEARYELVRAGFFPRGGGEIRIAIEPAASRAPLNMVTRGALVSIHGVSSSAKIKDDVAKRQRDAAAARLWEARRIEADWRLEELKASSPGSAIVVTAVFENGRGAFGFLGERGVRAEILGDRAARALLRFLEDDASAVDPHLADQLAVPMAVSGCGGRVTTSFVSPHLITVVDVLRAFGYGARVFGREGGPGGLEVDPQGPEQASAP